MRGKRAGVIRIVGAMAVLNRNMRCKQRGEIHGFELSSLWAVSTPAAVVYQRKTAGAGILPRSAVSGAAKPC
jgi:hypothetical protein